MRVQKICKKQELFSVISFVELILVLLEKEVYVTYTKAIQQVIERMGNRIQTSKVRLVGHTCNNFNRKQDVLMVTLLQEKELNLTWLQYIL